MNDTEAIEVSTEALWVIMKVGGPVLLIALAVGLIISLFQALTQIQEMTLTFVPKMVIIFLALMMLAPWMLHELIFFTEGIADKIIALNDAN